MSRYLSQISRRNHAISCLYYKAKKCHIFVTQLFSHARMIGFTTTCDQTCDRTKVTRMIFASTAMKLFLNTCKYSFEVYVLNGLIVHRSLAIILTDFACGTFSDSGLAKLSIQLQAVKIVYCYHPFFGHH